MFSSSRVLFIGFLTMCATAAVGKEKIAIAGLGTMSCGRHLEAITKNEDLVQEAVTAWVQGFLSGANTQRAISGKPFVALPDQPSLVAYVEKFCRDNPLKSVFEASVSLNQELR